MVHTAQQCLSATSYMMQIQHLWIAMAGLRITSKQHILAISTQYNHFHGGDRSIFLRISQ